MSASLQQQEPPVWAPLQRLPTGTTASVSLQQREPPAWAPLHHRELFIATAGAADVDSIAAADRRDADERFIATTGAAGVRCITGPRAGGERCIAAPTSATAAGASMVAFAASASVAAFDGDTPVAAPAATVVARGEVGTDGDRRCSTSQQQHRRALAVLLLCSRGLEQRLQKNGGSSGAHERE